VKAWRDQQDYYYEDVVAPLPLTADPITLIQSTLCDVVPRVALVDKKFDTSMIEMADISVYMEGCLDVRPAKEWGIRDHSCYEPVLKTGFSPPRHQTQRQSLLALGKRNLNVADNSQFMSPVKDAEQLVDKFMELFLVKDASILFRQEKEVIPNIADLKRYISRQPPKIVAQIERELHFHDIWHFDISLITAFIRVSTKPDPTPPTLRKDGIADTKIPGGQVIAHSIKLVNVIFGTLVDKFITFLEDLMLPHINWNKRKNVKQIQEQLSRSLGNKRDYIILEDDVSNYDKSQLEFAWNILIVLMTRCGYLSDRMARYMVSQIATFSCARAAGVAILRLFQRHSGFPDTEPFNSLIRFLSMAAVLYRHSPEDIYCFQVLGDDIIVFLRRCSPWQETLRTFSTVLLKTFNFTAKVGRFQVGYFCGYYILHAEGKVILMSDPVRRAIKLGRSDLKEEALIREYYTSFQDSLLNYDNAVAVEQLCTAIGERFVEVSWPSIYNMVVGLATLAQDYRQFRQLWAPKLTVTPYGLEKENLFRKPPPRSPSPDSA